MAKPIEPNSQPGKPAPDQPAQAPDAEYEQQTGHAHGYETVPPHDAEHAHERGHHAFEARVGADWFPADEFTDATPFPATPPNKHLTVYLPNGQTDTRLHVHPEDYRDAATHSA